MVVREGVEGVQPLSKAFFFSFGSWLFPSWFCSCSWPFFLFLTLKQTRFYPCFFPFLIFSQISPLILLTSTQMASQISIFSPYLSRITDSTSTYRFYTYLCRCFFSASWQVVLSHHFYVSWAISSLSAWCFFISFSSSSPDSKPLLSVHFLSLAFTYTCKFCWFYLGLISCVTLQHALSFASVLAHVLTDGLVSNST